MREQILFVEKYRPSLIDECILPSDTKKTFKEFSEKGQVPNLLLSGGPGIGKTTIAKALCNETNSDYIIINGSEESGIDLLRTKLDQYCSSVSFNGGRKVVIIDEADYLNPNSTQPAMRGFIEKFSNNCSFIFTCNYANRIIEPIHSRCSVFEFKIPRDEKPKVAAQFYRRVVDILTAENIQFDSKVVATLVEKYFPDFRRVLNEIQRYSSSGKIDAGILSQVSEVSLNELFSSLKEKNFSEMRKWVAQNFDNDPQKIYRKIYDGLNERLKEQSIPSIILILADYQYKAAFVPDQELNLIACLTEIMANSDFK